MRAWFDLTNSPHVLVLRPLIRALQEDGHDVSVTARDFAQTVALCERFGIDCDVIGRHRGAKLGAKAIGLVDRSYALYKYARKRRFDIAIGHGSNDISVAAKLLRVPAATMFDYEWAKVQHNVNCRLCAALLGASGQAEALGVGPHSGVRHQPDHVDGHRCPINAGGFEAGSGDSAEQFLGALGLVSVGRARRILKQFEIHDPAVASHHP